MEKIDDIKITNSATKNQIDQAIEIFYLAFKKKLRALIKSKEKTIAIYKKSINYDRVLYALKDEKVVGIVGLHYDNKNFAKIRYEEVRKHFNFFSGYFIYLFYKIATPKIKDDVLRIDSIAVGEDFRGRGVGSMLIDEVLKFAKKKKFKEVILEVVDTNPRAKKLYENIGFKEKKLIKYCFLTKPAGYSSEFVMSYDMANYEYKKTC